MSAAAPKRDLVFCEENTGCEIAAGALSSRLSRLLLELYRGSPGFHRVSPAQA